MAISWNTHDFPALDGIETSGSFVAWTKPEWAWDNNATKSAAVTLADGEHSEYLVINSITTTGYTGYMISRVWLGVTWQASSTAAGAFLSLLSSVAFDSGDNAYAQSYFWASVANTDQTDWLEITGFVDEWTWAILAELYDTAASNPIQYGVYNNTGGSVDFEINQLWIRVEYTTESPSRVVHTVKYDTGTTVSDPPYDDVDWTNAEYAWDDNDSNRASVTLNAGQYAYVLEGTAHDNVVSSGEIKCVNLEVKGYRTAGDLLIYNWFGIGDYDEYAFGNVNSLGIGGGDATQRKLTSLFTDSNGVTYGIDSDTWTWANFNNLDYAIKAMSAGNGRTAYINQLYATVIYYTTGETPGPYKLKYRKDAATTEITTYQAAGAGWNEALEIRVNGTTYYAQCDTNLAHANASSLRVRIGGVTYAVLTEEGTPT